MRYVISELPGFCNVVDTSKTPAKVICRCNETNDASEIARVLNADIERKEKKAANKKVKSIVVGLHG